METNIVLLATSQNCLDNISYRVAVLQIACGKRAKMKYLEVISLAITFKDDKQIPIIRKTSNNQPGP